MKKLALIGAAWLSFASAAYADVTCTLRGTFTYAPADLFYCDSSIGGCTGWLETDLDTKTSGVPVPYLKVVVRNSANTTTLATTHTNASGFWSTTFTLTGVNSCAGQSVKVRRDFARVHEADVAAATPRYRFQITSNTGSLQTLLYPLGIALTDANSRTQTWNNLITDTDTNDYARWQGVYYTMNSAISEIINWSSSLSTQLASTTLAQVLQAQVASGDSGELPQTNTVPTGFGNIQSLWDYYAAGGVIRHELGHWINQLMHTKNQSQNSCRDDAFAGSTGHTGRSCEYTVVSSSEGIADFVAVRSITSADTNAWICYSAMQGGYGRDICSDLTFGRLADADNDGIGDASSYKLIGDDWANSATRCAVPDATTCGCGANCATSANRALYGHRIETQIARFLWDLIDTNNEGGLDDIDMSAGSLVTAWLGMPCDKNNTATWVDGSCNEPCPPLACKKDSYNPFDWSQMLPTDETAERALNCVANAID